LLYGKLAERDSSRATGTVARFQASTDGEGVDAYAPVIKFAVGSGDITWIGPTGFPEEFVVGERVPMRYDPADPQVSAGPDIAALRWRWVIVLAVAAACTMLAWWRGGRSCPGPSLTLGRTLAVVGIAALLTAHAASAELARVLTTGGLGALAALLSLVFGGCIAITCWRCGEDLAIFGSQCSECGASRETDEAR
jgi:hypothetical protein